VGGRADYILFIILKERDGGHALLLYEKQEQGVAGNIKMMGNAAI